MDKILDYLRLFFYVMRKLLELSIQVGIVGGVFWVAYTVGPEILDRVPKILDLFLNIDPKILLAMLTVGATILGSTITPAVLNHIQHKRQLEKEHRDKLIPTYEKWLKLVFDATKNGEFDYEAFQEVTPQLAQEIMLRGNDDVVNAFHAYIQASRQQVSEQADQPSAKEKDPFKILTPLESFFFSMRRTLGHKNKHIERKTLLSFLVRDVLPLQKTKEDTKALPGKKKSE